MIIIRHYLATGLLGSLVVACTFTPPADDRDAGPPAPTSTVEPTGGAAGAPVDLGTAGSYAILAKTGITTVPSSAITGDLGVSPIAASAMTGFSEVADPSNRFARASQVVGNLYAADYATPTPAHLTAAVTDMEAAFASAAARPPTTSELGAGDIGGMTLGPGVYRWSTALAIPLDLTLDGRPTDVWVFQVAQGLGVTAGVKVVLAGGAVPRNVFWQVSGAVTIGATAQLAGIVLTETSVTLGSGASVDGRLLAQTAVTLAANRITQP